MKNIVLDSKRHWKIKFGLPYSLFAAAHYLFNKHEKRWSHIKELKIIKGDLKSPLMTFNSLM